MRLWLVILVFLLIFSTTTLTQTIHSYSGGGVRVELCGANGTCVNAGFGVSTANSNTTVKVYVNNTFVLEEKMYCREYVVLGNNSLLIKPPEARVYYKLYTCFSGVGGVGYFEVRIQGLSLSNASIRELIIRGSKVISFPEWLVKESVKNNIVPVPPARCNAPGNTLVKTGDYIIVEASAGGRVVVIVYKAVIKPPKTTLEETASRTNTTRTTTTPSIGYVSSASVTSIPVYATSRGRVFSVNYIFIALIAVGALLVGYSALRRGVSSARS